MATTGVPKVIIIPWCSRTVSPVLGQYCQDLADRLRVAGIVCEVDMRNMHIPSWKLNHWEKHAPAGTVIIEIGERTIAHHNAIVRKLEDGKCGPRKEVDNDALIQEILA